MRIKMAFGALLTLLMFGFFSCVSTKIDLKTLDNKVFCLVEIGFRTDTKDYYSEENKQLIFANLPLEEIKESIKQQFEIELDPAPFTMEREAGLKNITSLVYADDSPAGYVWKSDENRTQYVRLYFDVLKAKETIPARVFIGIDNSKNTSESIGLIFVSKGWLERK